MNTAFNLKTSLKEEILVDEKMTINNTIYQVKVVLLEDVSGRLHYMAKIDEVKPIELKLNGDDLWIDTQKGVTEVSVAIGNLIEAKSY